MPELNKENLQGGKVFSVNYQGSTITTLKTSSDITISYFGKDKQIQSLKNSLGMVKFLFTVSSTSLSQEVRSMEQVVLARFLEDLLVFSTQSL